MKEYFSQISNTGSADGLANISSAQNLKSLREKFPMYFDLGTGNGLEIYVWQMSESSYYCGVLPGANRNYSDQELWTLHKNPATIEEMRVIISSYGLSQTHVHICPIQMPYSSYAYTITDEYTQLLQEMFWSGEDLTAELANAGKYSGR